MRQVKEVLPSDLSRIVQIHQNAFPDFFLTQLGPGFLFQYYSTVLEYPKGIFRVAEENGVVAGFVAGFVEPEGFYAALRRKKLRLGRAALPALLRNPGILRRLLYNFRRTQEGGELPERACELASLAVDPMLSGKGLGRSLVMDFIELARRHRSGTILLTTDTLENDRVNQFYERLGFSLHHTFTADRNRLMNEYRLDLTKGLIP